MTRVLFFIFGITLGVLLASMLGGCTKPSGPMELGDETYAPYGWTEMCTNRPEEDPCPR